MDVKISELIKRIKIVLGFMIGSVVILWATGSGMGFMSVFSEESQSTTFMKVLFSVFAVSYVVVFLISMKAVDNEDPGCGLCGFIGFIMLLIVSPMLCLVGLAIPCFVLFLQLQSFLGSKLNVEFLFSSYKTVLLSALVIICFYACVGILLQVIVSLFKFLISTLSKKFARC